MSRVGLLPIPVPSGVNITIGDGVVDIKGSKGAMQIVVPSGISLSLADSTLSVSRADDSKKTKSLHGLIRTLVANAIIGVEKPWEKRLEVVGTGFTVKLEGGSLNFKLGFSHPVIFQAVEGITFQTEGNRKVIVSGVNKQLVGEIAYQIKILKKPDVYKGKGIRYEGEVIRLKPGKKAKTAGA